MPSGNLSYSGFTFNCRSSRYCLCRSCLWRRSASSAISNCKSAHPQNKYFNTYSTFRYTIPRNNLDSLACVINRRHDSVSRKKLQSSVFITSIIPRQADAASLQHASSQQKQQSVMSSCLFVQNNMMHPTCLFPSEFYLPLLCRHSIHPTQLATLHFSLHAVHPTKQNEG